MDRTSVHAWDGARVRQLRAQLNLTIEDFAILVGVRSTTVSRWENGHRYPQRLAQRRLEQLAREVQR